MDAQISQTIPSVEDIAQTCALPEPVLRNLKITYSYHLLSHGVRALLQNPNINWCTFATWASRQAGVTIRNEEFPKFLRDRWDQDARLERALLRMNPDPLESFEERLLLPFLDGMIITIKHTTLGKHIEHTAGDVSKHIANGNLKVFEELAPHFERLITTFEGAATFDADQHDAFLKGFRPGSVEEKDGQDLLRQAFSHYIYAIYELEQKQKAERILLANTLVGLHEQKRLQPQIESALNAPIKDTLGARIRETVQRFIPGSHKHLEDDLIKMFNPLLTEAEDIWRSEATRHMMTLKIADEVLDLGSHLAAMNGINLYPRDLENLKNPDVVVFMSEHYTPWDPEHQDQLPPPGSTDWAVLKQRMDYIIGLFRSRQQKATMYNLPFTPEQIAEIRAGRVPEGPLGN